MRHTNFMRRSWSDACTAAEMPEGLRFHDLRHFCAHFHIGLGFDLYAIKDMLGHSSIKVTADIYGGRFNSVRKAMADAVSRHQAERDLRIQEATGLPSISPISGSENGVILPFVPRSYHAAETGKG
jgi:integrase